MSADSPASALALDWFDPGQPGRPVKMGMTAIPLADWLLPDAERPVDLRNKTVLCDSRHDEVVAALPGSEAASEELRTLIEHQLTDLGLSAQEGLAARTELHPIDRAGRLVQEDLCLHQPLDGAYALTAASLCAPTRWRLDEKIGRSLDDIHLGVPNYAERVGRRVNGAFRAFKPLRPMRRTNWSVLDDDALFQPDSRHDLDPLPHDDHSDFAVAGLWLRVEVQTLLRLEVHDAIVFSIRVLQAPFAAIRTRPDRAQHFAEIISALPDDTARYKGLARTRNSLADWLRNVADHGS